MVEIQMDKVKSILSHMDDNFWQLLINQNNELQRKAETLMLSFMDNLTKLSVAQINIVETKFKGYRCLVENKKKTAVSGIVKANKASIDTLTKQKCQYVDTLTKLLSELSTIIEEAQDLGVKQGGENY